MGTYTEVPLNNYAALLGLKQNFAFPAWARQPNYFRGWLLWLGMESFVITPKTPHEREAVQHFLRTEHLKARVLSDEEEEDLGMLLLMSEVDPNDTVPESEIRKIFSVA